MTTPTLTPHLDQSAERALFLAALQRMPEWVPEYERHRGWVEQFAWFVWLEARGMGEAAPEAPEQAAQPVAQRIGEYDRRRILDAIRFVYDLGYNDARNARAVPGDSAPGYAGQQVEAARGAVLIADLERRAAQPADVARLVEALRNLLRCAELCNETALRAFGMGFMDLNAIAQARAALAAKGGDHA